MQISKFGVISFSFLISAFFLSSITLAHEPIFVDSNATSFDSSFEISDLQSSKAVYDELPSGKYIRFFKIHLKEEDSIKVSILIPKIAGNEDFNPAIVVMSDNVAQTFPKVPISLIGTDEFTIVEYDKNITDIFEEGFTGTIYYVHQSFNVTATKESDYFLTVFDREMKGGKYVLSIGNYEKSGLLDVASFPYNFLRIRVWYGDYIIPAAILAAVSLAILFLFDRKTKILKGKLQWILKSRQKKKSKG